MGRTTFRKGANYGRIMYLAEIRSKSVGELLPFKLLLQFSIVRQGFSFPFQRIFIIVKSFFWRESLSIFFLWFKLSLLNSKVRFVFLLQHLVAQEFIFKFWNSLVVAV